MIKTKKTIITSMLAIRIAEHAPKCNMCFVIKQYMTQSRQNGYYIYTEYLTKKQIDHLNSLKHL